MCEKLYPVNTKLDTFLNPLDLNTRSARLLVIVSSDSHESYTLNLIVKRHSFDPCQSVSHLA